MLPAAHRLTEPAAFAATVRTGVRAGSRALVVHVGAGTDASAPARVGLVVGRTVGNAVVRNRVKRRLRHQVADLVPMLPTGSIVVLRALPAAAELDSAALAGELRAGVVRCLARTPEKVAPEKVAPEKLAP